MKVTRRELRNEIRTLTAQRDRLLLEVDRLQAELYKAQRDPALAENVRLAHHLEVAERERDQAEKTVRHFEARFADLARRFPHIFPMPDRTGT